MSIICMKKIFKNLKFIIIALIFTVAINWVSAAYVSKPSAVDPAGNLVPINTGNVSQQVLGPLAIGSTSMVGGGFLGSQKVMLYVNGDSYFQKLAILDGEIYQTGSLYSNNMYLKNLRNLYTVSTGGSTTGGSSSTVYVDQSLCIDTNKEVVICS